MATDVGEAVIRLKLGGNIEKEVTKAGRLLKEFSIAGKAAGKVIAVGMAAGATGVATLAKSAVSAYADWEQLIGGAETLFKDSARIIDQYAQQAYKTAGLSANQYMETVTGFSASLLQSLGGDTAEAAEYGNQAVIDMSDNANKMGTDMQRIQDAYQGFAKQNYTMLDNLKLGYGGTKTEMERLLADASKISGMKFNIDSFADVTQAIHVIQENMGIAGTTAREAESTISGSLNQVKASWGNLLAFMGGGTSMPYDEIFPALTNSIKTLVNNLMPIIKNAIINIAGLLSDLAPILADELPPLVNDVLPQMINAATIIVNGIIKALPKLIVGLTNGLMSALPQLISGISQAIVELIHVIPEFLTTQLPVILPQIISAFGSLIIEVGKALTEPSLLNTLLNAAITLFMSIVQALPEVLTALIGALPQIISNIILFLTDPNTIGLLIQAAITLFFALVSAVPQILGALLGAFSTLVGNLWNGIKEMFGRFAANFGDFIGGIFKSAINGVLGFIESIINGPIDVINGFIDMINGAFSFIGVNLGKISRVSLPRLATGGAVWGPGTGTSDSIPALLSNGEYVINAKSAKSIGYKKLDLINSTGSLDIFSSMLSNDDFDSDETGGNVINVTQNLYINNEMEADDIGRKLMTSIRRAA